MKRKKKTIWDLCTMLFLSWNRRGYFSPVFVYHVVGLQQHRDNVRYASCVEA